MSIDQALEAKILRYHFVEQWGVHTIAAQLNIHHSTVARVLSQAGMPRATRAPQPSMIDPYLPFITETLEKFPKLTAARLYAMAQARGYPGGPSHFRAHIAQLRPKPPAEAYLRLKTLPAEQAQVDWGHFGYIEMGRARRPLMAFVMVLSFSRQIFLRFYLNQRTENFIRGHVAAFQQWQGVPRVLLYDNLKSAVLDRRGNTIQFNPQLLSLSAYYRFEPKPVAVARGNEKGRVERAIRYIRDNFFAGCHWQDINDLNAQADIWCQGAAADRLCPEDRSRTVGDAFAQEQSQLLALPVNPFETDERLEVKVGKTPYARFDLNDYSVPHTHVRQTLTVIASLDRVKIYDGLERLAEHARSYDQGQQIEDPVHLEALLAYKQRAGTHRRQDRLAHAAPASVELIHIAVTERGHRPAQVASRLVALLERYGSAELEAAITQALWAQTPHPDGVQQILEMRREQRQAPPPISIPLPDHPGVKQTIRPASLASYDQLNPTSQDDRDQDEPENHHE